MSDYKTLRVLIIEDFENFSASLREMVVFYGVPYDHVNIASTGEAALKLLQENRYDLVLSDYNLGEGRNGNDVLEEAKLTGLLKSSCIYMMLTAENSMDMVMGALEYQPDEYLAKPFTKELLNGRVERLLKRRDQLIAIYTAIDDQKLEDAVAACTHLMAKYPRYKAYLLKLKTDLMMQLGHYPACQEIYQNILKIKFLPWVQLGLGKCNYHLEAYDQAKLAFQELVDQDKRFVPGWDWLAKTLKQLGDDQLCQNALANAADISPCNAQRQAQLGRLAIKNGDLEVAEKALSQSVKFGKNSIHRSSETYLDLTSVMSERVQQADPKEAKRMERRALVVMDELRKTYPKDPAVDLQSRIAEGKFHRAAGNDKTAEKLLQNAFELCLNDVGVIPAEIKEQIITELEKNDQARDAQQLVAGMQREESPHNKQAVELYSNGDLSAALAEMKLAIEDKPRSFSVNINFAQVALHHMVESQLDDDLMEQVRICFTNVQSLPRSDDRFESMHQLYSRYQKMAKSMAAG